MWTSPFYPNASTSWPDTPLDCGNPSTCLFNVFTDPTEHTNLAAAHPDIVQSMMARLRQLEQTVFSPNRGEPTMTACNAADRQWHGFAGPFLP